MANLFLQGFKNSSMGERIFFSTKDSDTGYPHPKGIEGDC